MTWDELISSLQQRLNLDSSYVDSYLPLGARRFLLKLLRDYNFPKSLRTQTYVSSEGDQSYALPADIKRELLVLFKSQDSLGSIAYTNPLRKRESFTPLEADRIPRFYWVQGQELWTDTELTADEAVDTSLILAYQSLDVDYNLDWMLAEYNDVIFTLCMYRFSAELGKPELMQMYAPLWDEDRTSIAKYVNELNFDNLDMVMKEPASPRMERYPR